MLHSFDMETGNLERIDPQECDGVVTQQSGRDIAPSLQLGLQLVEYAWTKDSPSPFRYASEL